jgi:RimJ/RimL family protein N-acetyltransferase
VTLHRSSHALDLAELCDEAVVVRVTNAADAGDMAAAVPAGEPAVWEPTPGPYTIEKALAIVAEWEDGRRRGERSAFTVRGADDGRYLGAVVLQTGTPRHPVDPRYGGEVEIAYWVVPAQRRRGLARRAVRLVVERLLAEGGFAAVWAEIEAGNQASVAVAEAAGLTQAGEVRRGAARMLVYRRTT